MDIRFSISIAVPCSKTIFILNADCCESLRNISDETRTRADLFQKSCGPMPKREVLTKAMGCTDNSDKRMLRGVVKGLLTKYLGDFKAFRDYDYAVVLYPLIKLIWQFMNREKLHGRNEWTRQTTHHVVHASMGDGRRNDHNKPKQDKKRADKRAEQKRKKDEAAQLKPLNKDNEALNDEDSRRFIGTETPPIATPAVLPSQQFPVQASTPSSTTHTLPAADTPTHPSCPVQPAALPVLATSPGPQVPPPIESTVPFPVVASSSLSPVQTGVPSTASISSISTSDYGSQGSQGNQDGEDSQASQRSQSGRGGRGGGRGGRGSRGGRGGRGGGRGGRSGRGGRGDGTGCSVASTTPRITRSQDSTINKSEKVLLNQEIKRDLNELKQDQLCRQDIRQRHKDWESSISGQQIIFDRMLNNWFNRTLNN
ncbi:hypothetical protein FN846DRAFT_895134 [Sphaerosporella brunnea]|uniref:Uncharacterized protein n=1 Tax=Sphaerosporella brunnea TaxID=1250544 RepID=A0A5J5EGK0_9PEZI|nr:hypothetical protein FN846DRAFT_895134 [Sphaerosporella brunnea]